jgi:hypothetical protein
MRILTIALSLSAIVLAVSPQTMTDHGPQKAVLPDWSRLLPIIPDCEILESSVHDNEQGRITQDIKYGRSTTDEVDTVFVELSETNCPTVTLAVTYPFTPPPAPPLTKEQLREQKKIAARKRKDEKKFRKFDELMRNIRHGPPPPRSFVFKGFPAIQYFGAPCDYTPCESNWTTTLSVQFSSNKSLIITVRRNFEWSEEILNTINFAGLDSAMTKWIESKNLESKK